MKRKELIFVMLFLGIVAQSHAQRDANGYLWEPDPLRAKEKFTLLGDDIKSKNFEGSKAPLSWLLANNPELHKSLYQKGASVYEGLVTTEKDEKKKSVYEDSAMIMYDLRIKYFAEEASVLNYKGTKALYYWGDRPEKFEEMYDLYEKIINLNGENAFLSNIKSYMYLVCIMKKNNKKGLDDGKVLDIQDKLTEIAEKNKAKGKDVAAWEEVIDYVEKQVEGCVTIDCDFVKNQYTPKLKENPNDTLLLKKMYGVMVRGKCTSDALFFELAKSLSEKAPTFGRLKTLALLYQQKGDETNFIITMEKAFKYGGTNSDRADLYLSIASKKAKTDYSAARAAALQVIQIDPNKASQVYSFIADLYMNSGGQCATADKDKAPVYNTVAYLAAYEMYLKAGNQAGANRAAQYFPTAEAIFTLGITEQIGSQIPVGCWIGGTATLRKR